MNDILSLGFMLYTTAVSLEMSDEPSFWLLIAELYKVLGDIGISFL